MKKIDVIDKHEVTVEQLRNFVLDEQHTHLLIDYIGSDTEIKAIFHIKIKDVPELFSDSFYFATLSKRAVIEMLELSNQEMQELKEKFKDNEQVTIITK